MSKLAPCHCALVEIHTFSVVLWMREQLRETQKDCGDSKVPAHVTLFTTHTTFAQHTTLWNQNIIQTALGPPRSNE